jgi:hypothetical protein
MAQAQRYQYAISRPAATAVTHVASEMPPKIARRRRSLGCSSRWRRAFHAGDRFNSPTLVNPAAAEVDDRRPAEQCGDPEDVQKIDDRIGPEAGGPHQFAKRGLLQPDESVAHYFLSGYTLNNFPLYVTRSVFTSKRFGSRWR